MEKVFIIITANSRGMNNPPDTRDGFDTIEVENLGGDEFCSVLTGVIFAICQEMSVEIIKTECFQKDNRMALIIKADATDAHCELDDLRRMLEMAGEKLNSTIRVQKEDLFRYMHRI